jgi:hypothetical protein
MMQKPMRELGGKAGRAAALVERRGNFVKPHDFHIEAFQEHL